MAPDRTKPILSISVFSMPILSVPVLSAAGLSLAVFALSLSSAQASTGKTENINAVQASPPVQANTQLVQANTQLAQRQNLLAQNDPYNPPILRGLDQNNSTSVTESAQSVQSSLPQTSPVESFFQVPPPTKPDAVLKAKPHSGAYKFVWHVMDNAGVPMFGNKDPDINPSLSRPFIMPPLTPDIPKAPDDTSANAGTKPAKPTIIDPDAAAQDPSQLKPDDTASKASSNSNPSPNPQ